tara:strand:+ start:175 stop:1062 length:888 start_codon:yes stop_codon:yes gene_type:complete
LKPKVVLTGSSGLLGHYLSKELSESSYNLTNLCFSKSSESFVSIDLRNKKDVFNLLDKIQPSIIIHAAALVDVDKCQSDFISAYDYNVKMTRNLVEWVKENDKGVRFVFISTDQVYSGNGPHKENNINPLNFYGMTKLWAEDVVLGCNSPLICRVNFVGLGNNDSKSFLSWVMRSLNNEKNFFGYSDILFNPLHGCTLAKIVKMAVKSKLLGVYNIGSMGGISKSQFIINLAKKLHLDSDHMEIINYKSLNASVPRPFDMRMDLSNISKSLKGILPDIDETINIISEECKSYVVK